MSSRYKGRKLTTDFVLGLLLDGTYRVDLETGTVYGRSGKPLKPRLGGKTEQYLNVYIYADDHRKKMPVAHLVWMTGARRVVPPEFEIHHRDKNLGHNWWSNLFCLFADDHRKLHNGKPDLLEEETPF